jgi:hypothetical protein
VFTNTYTPVCVGGVFTVPVNVTLPKGNGYKIVLTSATMQLNGNLSATTAFTNAQASLGAAAAGTLEIANLVYDYQNFTVTTTCSNRTAIPVSCSLPIQLLQFDGEKYEHGIRLYWSTASEKNNNYFDIEHSTDGVHFTSIGKTKGAINSSSINRYEFYDAYPAKGLNYYRLVQYDENGTNTNSPIISFNFQENATSSFTVVPNPSSSYFTLFLVTEMTDAMLTITDAIGKIIATEKINGYSITNIGQELSKGAYILTLTSSVSSESQLIIKE